MEKYHWHRYTVSESFDRIKKGENHWVAFGDFLDDWRRSNHEDRLELVNEPPREPMTPEERRWAALFAAAVEQICTQEEIGPPAWVKDAKYYLDEPWYPTVKTENMRRLYQEVTPMIFKQHNVFSGDRVLDRV